MRSLKKSVRTAPATFPLCSDCCKVPQNSAVHAVHHSSRGTHNEAGTSDTWRVIPFGFASIARIYFILMDKVLLFFENTLHFFKQGINMTYDFGS